MSATVTTSAPSATTTHAPPKQSSALVLVASLLSFFIISLDGSVVNVALPSIRDSFHSGISGLQWVVDGYTLMFAAFMLSAGALSDRIGAARAYALGLGGFTVASMACGFAPSLGVLVGARLVQGCAAAIMMPASLALIRQSFDDAGARARAIGIWTAAGATAVAVGPVVGGLLTSYVDWRWIFFVNLPVGVAGLVLLTRIPKSPRRTAALDPVGQLSAVVALACLTYAVIESGHAGHSLLSVAVPAAGAVIAISVFLLTESRAAQPMVELALFRSRRALVCLAAGFSLNAVFYGVIFLFGLYFQQLRGYSAATAGWMFIPLCALTPVMNMLGVRLAGRFGPRLPMVTGQAIMGAGALALIVSGPHTAVVWPILLLVPIGVGGGLAVPQLTAMMLDSVEPALAGTAAAVLNTVRQVGSCLAVAAFGAILAQHSFPLALRSCLVVGALVLAVTTAATAALLPRRTSA